MAEQEFNKVDDEKRARGGKRTSEVKIAEVSTSKSKKRVKKAPAKTPKHKIYLTTLQDILRIT